MPLRALLVCVLLGGLLVGCEDAQRPARSTKLPGWELIRDLDLSTDAGWTHNLGNQGRDASICRPSQARFGTGPDGSALTVTAERDSESAPVYSADMKLLELSLPNHFRAEVTARVSPLVPGLWPAALWFRPNGKGEGEIDVHEVWGKDPEPRESQISAIWTSDDGREADMIRTKSVEMDEFGDPTLEEKHTWAIEKVPGEMRYFIDGKLVARLDPESIHVSQEEWDSMWEVGTRWYPRVTFQVGPGTGSAGPLDEEWRRSDLVIDSMRFWRPADSG